jgi:succinate dehydrogenase / fumarate reductase iron-sulfur subunit
MVSSVNRNVTLRIRRSAGWQDFIVSIPPHATLLDALEEAQKHDPTLLFRHSCHHASCGSCGLRAGGRERLACITRLDQVTRPGKPVRLEPLRNFPLVSDLLVDFAPFMERLHQVDLPLIRKAGPGVTSPTRMENCIECGLCVSACPIAGSDPLYLGPAALAAAGRLATEPRGREMSALTDLVEGEHGIWRCHAAFECTEVCPAGVDPAREIMHLRGRVR